MTFKYKIGNINFSVDAEEERFVSGGVYCFLVNGIPLYIGETYYFFIRLAYHFFELKKNPSYFGLGDLEKEVTLSFHIINGNYAYDEKNEKMRKSERQRIEMEMIEKYSPILQNPKKEIQEIQWRKRRKDAIPKDMDLKNKIVNLAFQHSEVYKKEKLEIQEAIKFNQEEKI